MVKVGKLMSNELHNHFRKKILRGYSLGFMYTFDKDTLIKSYKKLSVLRKLFIDWSQILKTVRNACMHEHMQPAVIQRNAGSPYALT